VHIVLTDVLTCPSCGEEHGLIARSDRIVERRIIEGALACPNCKRLFPIVEGVAWLNEAGPAGNVAAAATVRTATAAPDEEAIRIAALLGLDRVRGFVLLAGPATRHAAGVAALAPGAGIVAAAGAEEPLPAATAASRLVIGGSLPFSSGSLRGIWLGGAAAAALLDSAARTLHPTARLVLDPAPDDIERRLPPGFRITARQERTVLCTRSL
jgi:uncharacterized protein YbaR (Trm112 family)